MPQKATVFISRVSQDFEEDARKLSESLCQLRFEVKEQWSFGSENYNESTFKIMVQKISQCHYFLGLLGDRVGWRPRRGSIPIFYKEKFDDTGGDDTKSKYSITQWEIKLASHLEDKRPNPAKHFLWKKTTDSLDEDQRKFIKAIEDEIGGSDAIDAFKHVDTIAKEVFLHNRDHNLSLDTLDLINPSLTSLFESPDSNNSFRPTYEDFSSGKLKSFSVAKEVKKSLDANKVVWLSSPSASGKTAIALGLAVDVLIKERVACIVDFSRDDISAGSFLKDLDRAKSANALVILDNIHRRHELAAKAIKEWESLTGEGQLLLLGWPLENRENNLSAYKKYRINHNLTSEDLECVYQFILEKADQHMSVEITTEIKNNWWSVHASNLVVFQYCVIAAIAENDIKLINDVHAASEYIMHQYITAAKDGSYVNDLALLAVCSSHGWSVFKQCLITLNNLPLDQGYIVKSKHGLFGRYKRYSLWHESFGKLLEKILGEKICKDALLGGVRKFPASGMILGHKAYKNDEVTLAKELFAAAIDTAQSIEDLALDSLVGFGTILKSAKACDNFPEKLICKNFAAVLLPQAKNTRPDHLMDFINSANGIISGFDVSSSFAQEFEKLSNPEIYNWAIRSTPDELAFFLTKVGEHEDWKAVSNNIAKAFNGIDEKDLTKWAIRSTPDELAFFLTKVGELEDWKNVSGKIVAGFAAKDKKDLTEWAIRSTPDELAFFLTKVGELEDWKNVSSNIAKGFNGIDENDLTKWAIRSTPDKLAFFLTKVGELEDWKNVSGKIVAGFAAKDKKDLTEWAIRSTPDELAFFLTKVGEHEDWKAVSSNIVAGFTDMGQGELTKWACRSTPDELASFLTKVGELEDWKNVSSKIVAGFTDMDEAILEKWVLRASADGVANFIGVMADIDIEVAKRVKNHAIQNLTIFWEIAFSKMTALLEKLPKNAILTSFSNIKTELWNGFLPKLTSSGPNSFGVYAQLLISMNQKDKVVACANYLMDLDPFDKWKSGKIGIYDLHQVLSWSDSDKSQLLDQLSISSWIQERYGTRTPNLNFRQEAKYLVQGIAAFLRDPPMDDLCWLKKEQLIYRTNEELEVFNFFINKEKDEEILEKSAIAIQLWACTALLMPMRKFRTNCNFPLYNVAQRILDTQPLSEEHPFGPIHQQLWMGLRILTRASNHEQTISTESLTRARSCWKDYSKACSNPTAFDSLRDDSMLAWLEAASSNQGILPKDECSLIQALKLVDLPHLQVAN